jgi:hypothetical protein
MIGGIPRASRDEPKLGAGKTAVWLLYLRPRR